MATYRPFKFDPILKIKAESLSTDEQLVGKITASGLSGISFDAGNNKIAGVSNGTNPSDAVNFSQLSSIASGNLTLTAPEGSNFPLRKIISLNPSSLTSIKLFNPKILNENPIGLIISASFSAGNPDSYQIQTSGLVSGFTGLVAGSNYFSDSLGELIEFSAFPTAGGDYPRYHVLLGQALTSSSLFLNIQRPILMKVAP
jgi:hypothetical protein